MKELNNFYELELGKMSYHMVSAHVYDRDFDYVSGFISLPAGTDYGPK